MGKNNECHYEARGPNIRDILAKSLVCDLLCLPHSPCCSPPAASEVQIRCENIADKDYLITHYYLYIHSLLTRERVPQADWLFRPRVTPPSHNSSTHAVQLRLRANILQTRSISGQRVNRIGKILTAPYLLDSRK